jgi:hypothetical protein
MWAPGQDLMHAIFKHVWSRRTERGGGVDEAIEIEVIPWSNPDPSRRHPLLHLTHSDRQIFCSFFSTALF